MCLDVRQDGLPGLLKNVIFLSPPRVSVRELCEVTLKLIENYSLGISLAMGTFKDVDVCMCDVIRAAV